MSIQIDSMLPTDWPAVERIYAEGIASGNATFEQTTPNWDAWNASKLPAPRLVARREGEVVGWAALSPVSSRPVYKGVAEVSIYIAAAARGQGIGKALLRALVQASEDAGFWTLQAGIFPENVASIRLHLGCGFRILGRHEKLGQHNGRWRDVLLLERRSPVVG